MFRRRQRPPKHGMVSGPGCVTGPATATGWTATDTGTGVRVGVAANGRGYFEKLRRRWAWVVGYVGSGGSRWRRSPCNCSAVAATSVLLTGRKSCCQATARASAERCVTERNRLSREEGTAHCSRCQPSIHEVLGRCFHVNQSSECSAFTRACVSHANATKPTSRRLRRSSGSERALLLAGCQCD